MYTQKIDVQKHKGNGSINCYSGRGSLSQSQQPWKKDTFFHPDQFPASEGGSPKQMINLGITANMTTTIVGHFGSPVASALYAPEAYMGFPECDSYSVNSETPSYPSSNIDPECSPSRDTQNIIPNCLEKSSRTPFQNLPVCDILFVKPEFEDEQYPYRILRENQNQTVSDSVPRCCFCLVILLICIQIIETIATSSLEWNNEQIPYHELVQPRPRLPLRRQSADTAHNTTCVASNKTRIRWTRDLHKRFVESVNRLGGAESEHI